MNATRLRLFAGAFFGGTRMKRTPFPVSDPESVGIRSRDILDYLDALESSDTEMHGLMIMRHGTICCQGWWAPYAPGLRHGLQSHTKTYAATAVGIACREGLLSLDEPVLDVFPEYAPASPNNMLKRLKVRHVLCMGCGMDTMPSPTKDWIRDFLHTPVVHEPGTTYMYNSFGSTLLGAMVRQRSGLGLHDYLKPRLFDKIGIDSDNLRWVRLPDGMEVGGGGLFATTEDNLRLMKLYLDGGLWEGERILSAEYVRLATTNQNNSATEARNNPLATDNFLGYGFQIWMCKPAGAYRADGAMGQFTIVLPNLDMIIAINETASGAGPAQHTLDITWEFVRRVISDSSLPPDPACAAQLRQRLKRLNIGNPEAAPLSPSAEEISGHRYQVVSGGFGPFGGNFMSGELPDPIDSFQLDFDGDGCCWSFITKSGKAESVRVGLRGERYTNLIGNPNDPTRLYLCSGIWTGDREFQMACRFAESCVEDQYTFRFDADCVHILAKNNSAFQGPEPLRVEAIRIK